MDGISIRATGMSAKFQSKVTQMRAQLTTEGNKAVEAQMVSIRQVIVNTSPVDTGRLKASWSPVRQVREMAYATATGLHYAATLEYGGYPKVGPKTVRLGGGELGAGFVAEGGIYSRQAPLGFVRKALAGSVTQFRLRIRNILRQAWGGLGSTDASDSQTPTRPPRNWNERQSAISPTGNVDPEVLAQIFASFQRR